MSKKRKEWLAIGNFEVGAESNSSGLYVVLRTVQKDWSVRWREDTLQYGMMLSLAKNADAREYLHSLITVIYVASTYPHDLVSLTHWHGMPFMEGFARLVDEQNSYEQSVATDDKTGKKGDEETAIKYAALLEDMQREVAAAESEEQKQSHDKDNERY